MKGENVSQSFLLSRKFTLKRIFQTSFLIKRWDLLKNLENILAFAEMFANFFCENKISRKFAEFP